MFLTDPNLILTKSVVAIYLNGIIEEKMDKVANTVNRIIQDLKLPENVLGEGSEGDVSRSLKLTYEWLKRSKIKEISEEDVIARIRMNCAYKSEYIEVVKDLINTPKDKENLTKRLNSINSELQHELDRQTVADMFRKANRELNMGQENVDLSNFVNEFVDKTRDVMGDLGDSDHEGLAGQMDFSKLDEVEEFFERSKDIVSEVGVMRTGYQGLNKLLGVGGIQPGFMYCFPALSHNYKTGILLDISRQIPMYNKPNLTDPDKKPLVYRISFENKIEQDLPEIYRSIYEAENQVQIQTADIKAKEAAQYVSKKLTDNGWHFIMECYDPNNFDVWNLIDRLNYFESQGYEVKLCVVDYLELITRANSNSRKDQAITYGYEVLRNHCFPRGIAVVTAHQLSTEAQKLAREGTAGFAAKCASGGYYQNCQSLHNKLDCEVVMHIHKQGDDSFLTFARGKHRGGAQTPIKDRTFAMKFQQYGGLCDDVLSKKSTAVYNLSGASGAPLGSAEEDW